LGGEGCRPRGCSYAGAAAEATDSLTGETAAAVGGEGRVGCCATVAAATGVAVAAAGPTGAGGAAMASTAAAAARLRAATTAAAMASTSSTTAEWPRTGLAACLRRAAETVAGSQRDTSRASIPVSASTAALDIDASSAELAAAMSTADGMPDGGGSTTMRRGGPPPAAGDDRNVVAPNDSVRPCACASACACIRSVCKPFACGSSCAAANLPRAACGRLIRCLSVVAKSRRSVRAREANSSLTPLPIDDGGGGCGCGTVCVWM
jgi:hypothetical protein